MDLSSSPGQSRTFSKDDFEADWVKVAECRFGQVYRVRPTLRPGVRALKVFDCGDHFYRRLMDEAPRIAKVRFQYIVSVYGPCGGPTALVMEYMSNGSLNNLLSSHTLMWPKKFQMIHEACMGMNFLHSMQPPLLHLNLKTSNILLDDHLHVKISDFGLICWEEGMNQRSFLEHLTARGNLSYIPPETFSQSSDPPGTAFDVYSFGVVTWEILTQQKPHAGCSVTSVILDVSHGKRPSLEMIPEQRPHKCDEMIAVAQECWDQDPRRRPQFSDTVKRTEALSPEVLDLPGTTRCHNSGGERRKSDQFQTAAPETPDVTSDARRGQDAVLSLLLKKDFGAFRQSVKRENVFTQFAGKKSLLHYTVASGDAASVERVLHMGAEVNCPTDGGYTPLLIAVLHRFHEIISLLLQRGADVAQGDEEQWTALHFAGQSGDDRAVRLLLDSGAAADVREKSGWTPLHLACQNGHEPVVRLLLSRLPSEAVGEREEAQGRTPLHLASAYGHLNIAKLLLSHGADPAAVDRSLSTPLHAAAEEGHNRLVRQLMRSGAGVDSADGRGYTPLHLAALRGHTGICRQLLSNGAGPDRTTRQGWTALHLASLKGHDAAAVQLESQGACVNARGESGWTPLHLACHQGGAEVAAKLLAAAADPDMTEDSEGWTPLHMACANMSLPNVLCLISHHAGVNAPSRSQATPLHLAARRGSAPIVEALLLNGADRTLTNSSGSTPVDVARRAEKWDIVQLLEN